MTEIKEYMGNNSWQQNRYTYMSQLNRENGITDFNYKKKGGTRYYHLITQKDRLKNFLNEEEILKAVLIRFEKKAGDKQRILTNTVASQPCCFNLFVPLQNRKKEADRLFSIFLDRQVEIDEMIIEFTPEIEGEYGDESLGDQSKYGGTDSDVAVFYTSGNRKGVIIIEFKYIEDGFSVCTSYKKENKNDKIRHICNDIGFYEVLIEPNLINKHGPLKCGYLKYFNWQLTRDSKVIDNLKVKNHAGCPFRFSGQQLWRNILLAENVALKRKLDEFFFWVIAPVENKWLWMKNGLNTEEEFRKILTPKGNSRFRALELEKDFFRHIKNISNDSWFNNWAEKFEKRYLTGTQL